MSSIKWVYSLAHRHGITVGGWNPGEPPVPSEPVPAQFPSESDQNAWRSRWRSEGGWGSCSPPGRPLSAEDQRAFRDILEEALVPERNQLAHTQEELDYVRRHIEQRETISGRLRRSQHGHTFRDATPEQPLKQCDCGLTWANYYALDDYDAPLCPNAFPKAYGVTAREWNAHISLKRPLVPRVGRPPVTECAIAPLPASSTEAPKRKILH